LIFGDKNRLLLRALPGIEGRIPVRLQLDKGEAFNQFVKTSLESFINHSWNLIIPYMEERIFCEDKPELHLFVGVVQDLVLEYGEIKFKAG